MDPLGPPPNGTETIYISFFNNTKVTQPITISRAEKNTWQLLKKYFLSANKGLKVRSLKT